jgi:hypothetical protein
MELLKWWSRLRPDEQAALGFGMACIGLPALGMTYWFILRLAELLVKVLS